MSELAAVVLLVALIGAIARLAARHFHPELPFGLPLGAASREELWRRAMPWPHGVQEEADLSWHVPLPARSADPPSRPPVRPTPPTRPQPRLIGR